MATETRIRIKRNPYQGYEVWLWGNGELTRRSFDNSFDLSNKLAADCVSDQDIEAACDLFERLEWEEPEYPLGVSYRPHVGEAVCDSPIDEPIQLDCTCDYCLHGHNAALVAELQSDMRTMYRRVGWVLVLIGVVAWFC